MTTALLALLAHTPAAIAGVEDVVLDLRVVEPMGTTLIDDQVEVPFKQTYELQVGQEAYKVVVEAELEAYGPLADGKVEVVAAIYRLDGPMRSPVRLSSPTLVLPMDASQSAATLVDAPDPVWGPDGQPMNKLRWELHASWTERRAPTWLTEARARPIAEGEAVLAWADATIYAAPGVAAGRLRSLDDRTLDPGSVLAWAAVEDQGEWVRVAALPGRKSRKHCFPGDPVLYGLDVQAWIKREDLVLVTHTSAVMDYSDGSGSSLAAGVPLSPVDGQTLFGYPLFESVAHGLSFRIPLPPAPLALGYVPLGGSLEKQDDFLLQVPESGILGETGAGPVRSLSSGERRGVTSYMPQDGGMMGVSVGDHCGEHRLVVPMSRLEAVPEAAEDDIIFGAAGGEVGGVPPETFELPFGVMLYWADGTEAGIARRPVEFTTRPAVEGKYTCLDLAAEGARQRLTTQGGASLKLCAETADLPPPE